MNIYIPRDIKDHLVGGLLTAFALWIFIIGSQHWGSAVVIALAGPVFGWAVERYQAIRRAGVFDYRDLVATAIPFELLALSIWLFG